MKHLAALVLALCLTGCLGGGGGGALPPELQGGTPVGETSIPIAGDPLAEFPPISPTDPPSNPTPAPEPVDIISEPLLTHSNVDCEAVTADLETSFVDMNFCTTDSDCAVAVGSCPFGCYLFHNAAIEFDDYQPALTAYQENCDPCEYQCASAPRAADRRCREGRCVDARYE